MQRAEATTVIKIGAKSKSNNSYKMNAILTATTVMKIDAKSKSNDVNQKRIDAESKSNNSYN